jgi:HD superfamily phosphohydrolase
MIEPLRCLLDDTLNVENYLSLDEALAQTAFTQWTKERDSLLSDLCSRFLNRRLYKYAAVDKPDEELWQYIRGQFQAIGLNPEYHFEIDFPYDMPYDVYRPGLPSADKEEKPPILLLGHDERLSEISERSDIIRSITGLHQGKYHLYYPEERLLESAAKLPPRILEYFGLL